MPVFKELEGVREMVRQFDVIGKQFIDDASASLLSAAEVVLTFSKRSFVPVDLGPLRGSGVTAGPERKGAIIRVVIAYGSPTVDYAIVQHEETDFAHKVGVSKYLQRPLEMAASSLLGSIAKDVKF